MIGLAGIEPPVVIGVDVGTQTIRVLAFDACGRHLVTACRPTPTENLTEGGGEYDPDTIWARVEVCLAETVASLPSGMRVAGIAVASVGESCVLVDGNGRAAAPVLVWHDRRTEPTARAIEARLGRARLFELTGHRVDPTFGLCKLVWMREHWPERFARSVGVLNVADWIAFRLCGVAATDFTLASRTLALDIHRRSWSDEILDGVGFRPEFFAPLTASGTALGAIRSELSSSLGFAAPPVVGAGGHDHLCGMFAAGAARPGVLLDSLGTAEALLHAIPRPLTSPEVLDRGYFQGRIEADSSLAYLGAGIMASGGAIEWFRSLFADGLAHADLIAEARAVPPGARGVAFLPHLVYAPPPYPDLMARGAFVGLTTDATRGSLFRAVLEGLALEARLVLEGMTGIAGVTPPREIRVIGGNSRNALFLDIKASILARPLTVIDEPEATALGAALLGGLAAEVWPDLDQALAAINQPQHTVAPYPLWTEPYVRLYEAVHLRLRPALRDVNRSIVQTAVRNAKTDTDDIGF